MFQLATITVAITVALALISAPATVAQSQQTVSYDASYDVSSASTDTVSCSGIFDSSYPTFGSLPDFPYIGGAYVVNGYDSAGCGTCWELSYNGNTVTILVIDHADDGFNISEEAMQVLGAVQAGRVTATATQVDASACGL